MRILFALVAVFLLVSIIDAAPKPSSRQKQAKPTPAQQKTPLKRATPAAKVQEKRADKNKRQSPFFLPGNPVYPNFYAQPSSPLVDFPSALQAAFLSGVHYAELEKYLKKQNLTDPSGKALPLNAGILADFDAAYGYTIGDGKNFTDLQQKLVTFENIGNVNVVNPFLPVSGYDGKAAKAENGATVKDVKPAEVNSSVVSLVSPYHSNHVNALFAPEIAPRYEIHYSPAQGITVDPLPALAGAGISSAAVGVAPVGPAIGPSVYGPAAFESAAYGPEVGYPGFGIAPGFNNLLSPYPYPYPFAPGFDPKGIKPNGKGNDGKSAESTSPTYPDATPGAPSEAPPSESSSEPSSDSSSSEAPQ